MLNLKLSQSAISIDGTSITLTDITGVYNAGTNPGGYGAPNPDSAASTTTMVRYKPYYKPVINIPVSTAEMIAGKVFDTNILTLTTGTPALIPDGVTEFEYLVGYVQTDDVTAAGNIINLNTVVIPANTKYISLSGNTTRLYEVKSINGSMVTLKCSVDLDGTYKITNFYNTSIFTLITTMANRIIDNKVLQLSGKPCDRDIELFGEVMNLAAATAQFNITDYQGANALVTTFNLNHCTW